MYLWLSLKPQTTAQVFKRLGRGLRAVAGRRLSPAAGTREGGHLAGGPRAMRDRGRS